MSVSAEYSSGIITLDELDELSSRHPQGGFQQTSNMARLSSGVAESYEALGVRDGSGALVAGCLVAYTASRFGLEGSVWMGPLCDPHDIGALRAITEELRRSAARHGAIAVTCWPDVPIQPRDSFGQAVGELDQEAMDAYAGLGWRHAGFTRGYGSVVNRWVYVKNLEGLENPDQLLASYSKNTRRNVKIAANSGVEVRGMSREELGTFHEICGMSSEKQHFRNRELAYFQRVFDTFGDRAEFMVGEIHYDRYLASWQEKLAAFTAEAERLESQLPEAKYPDAVRKKLDTARRNELAASKRVQDAQEVISREGAVVPAAVGLFVWHERELVYLSSGSDPRFMKFYAPTAIQHEMMSRCLERGLKRYNFYGISGVFDDPDDPGRGVLEFKQGFNGNVEELIGEFTLPVDKLRFGVKEFASKLLRH
ncbi:peptidoglycan branched peptide synthesis protein [Bifidobacterium lemurum]|uniref:Peptidoglycan branched peptide synthesis protein n=1 Tax=Bifidobacterium lemurum TaxID=1603886 RepID=A0A261FP93_9BIFI|nr:aminoacyltransferase [Bifidobacterium lemurum]OZG60959.1 peptidoglycan branched peptide synthesis protein [Bifidobacterium lemurum]QOL34757.1 aminoacyltransferase [Bifidobacterium lemurum]